MGIMVYSLLWVVQDLYHQPYVGTETLVGAARTPGAAGGEAPRATSEPSYLGLSEN